MGEGGGGGLKRKYDEMIEVTILKILDSPQHSRGKGELKQGTIRNHCEAMDLTTPKSEDGMEK